MVWMCRTFSSLPLTVMRRHPQRTSPLVHVWWWTSTSSTKAGTRTHHHVWALASPPIASSGTVRSMGG